MDKFINFGPGKYQQSQLRNGLVYTCGISLSLSNYAGNIQIESLNRRGGTHTGRIVMPADVEILEEMAGALLELAAEIEGEKK